MTSEEFALQLGQIQGTLAQIVRQNDLQIGLQKQLETKVDQVRTDLTAKIEADVGKVNGRFNEVAGQMAQMRTDLTAQIDSGDKSLSDRVDGHDVRLRKVETEGASRAALVGLTTGGLSALAVALAVRIGEAWLKIKGGQ